MLLIGEHAQGSQAGNDEATDVHLTGADALSDLRLAELVEEAQFEDTTLSPESGTRSLSSHQSSRRGWPPNAEGGECLPCLERVSAQRCIDS